MADKRTAFKASAQSAQKKKKRTREQEQQTQENRSGTASLSRQTTQTGGTRDINAQRTLEDRRTVTAPKRSSAERTRSTSESRSSNSEWTGGGGANQNPKPHRKQSTATKRARTFKSQQAKENLRQERRDSQQYDPRSGYILRMGLGDDSIESFMQDVEDYANGANSRLGTISPSYDSHSTTYSSLIDSAESLRGRAGNIRAHLNTNRDLYGDEYYDEMMRYLDSVEEFTSGIDRRAKSYEDLVNSGLSQNQFNAELRDRYYRDQYGRSIANPDQSEIKRLRNYANTAWEQGDDRAAMEYEDQINWLSENTTGGRMWRYEQNNARIEEIQKQIADLDKRYRPDDTGVINAAQEQERQNLVNELNNLQTWNRQYERNSEWGIDVTNVARRVDDFNEYSHADSYGDPNLDEIEADRAQVYGIADQEGNVYIDDGSFTNMTPVLDGGPSPSPTTLRDFKDPLGAYLSWSDEQKSQYVQQPNTSYGAVADAGTSGNWDFINDNELAVYYYYLNKDNVESAQAYLRSLDGTLLDRAKNQLAEDIQNASAGELFIRNVISVPQQVVGGAAAFGGALGNALRGEGFRSGNAGMWQFAAGQTRAETAGRIDDATGNKTLLGISLGDAYQAGMSALDSMLGAKMSGGAYTVFMGMGAAAQKAEEAYLSGASDQEIVSTALIAGALEYLSEKIAWEKLIGTPAAKTKVQAVFRGLEQAGFEGAEEVVSSVGNNIADLLIMGDRSSFETTKRQLLAENPGMSDSDASFEALKLSLGDLWKDFVGGFISGFGMGMADSFLGVYSGEGYKQYRDAYKQAGLSLENSGATDAVIANARVTAQEKTAAQDKQNARDVKRSQGELARSADRAQNQTKRAREVRDAAQRSGIADSNMSNPYAAAAADYFNQKRAQYRANRAAVEVGRTVQLTSDTMDALNLVDADNAKARDVRFFQGLIGISPAQASQNAVSDESKRQGMEYVADESKRALAASDDGRAHDAQGNAITIDGVADVQDGKLMLATTDGEILPADLISYATPEEALVYETIQRMNVSKASAIALSEAYKAGEVSAQEFALGVNQAYNFGRIGVDMDKAISRSESFAANLTQQQRITAYRMGQIDAQTSFDAQQSAIDTRVANAAKSADVKIGKVIYEFNNSGFRMNEQQRQGVQIAKMVSALTGADVHLYESYERDGKRYYKDASGNEAVAPNGFYSNGSVWVDVNAGNNGQGIVGVTLSHEFTHFIQEWSPEKFKVLGDYVIRRFNESNVNVDELVRAQMEKAKRARGEALSYDEAYAEVVADSMEQMFTGEKSQALEQLAELKKQDATLWGKIKEWFKRIAKRLNAIRKAYSDVEADNETAAVVRGIDNFVEQASKIFAEGLDDAGKNYMAAGDAAADSAARLSGRKNPAAITEQDVLNLFENALNGEYDDGTYIPVRAHTPEVYIRAVKAFDETSSIKDLPMIMNVKKAIQTMEEGGATYYGNRRPHEIDPFDFAQAIQKMDDPLYIVHQENGRYTEIVSFRGSRPLKTLFVIEFEAQKIAAEYANGYSGGLYNMIVTTYNPDSIQGYLEHNEIIYTKKEGVLPRGSGRKMAVALEQAPSTDNISQNDQSVKKQFSMRETVEETRDLLALHNLTDENLKSVLKLGGFPMPSIAVVKAEQGHSKYGPISLVLSKSTIDPQADSRNHIYGADAYTPTVPSVEYAVSYDVMTDVERTIADLSKRIADGIFTNSSVIRRLGIDDTSTRSIEQISDLLANDESVRAAYLAEQGETMEPVMQDKVWNRYGNDALQSFVNQVGEQRLAQINADFALGKSTADALGSDAETIRSILREYYRKRGEEMLRRAAVRNKWSKTQIEESRRSRIERAMENNVSMATLESFARSAWDYYQDGGVTKGEIDRMGTREKLMEMTDREQVAQWLRGKLDGLLGEPGIYNGKDRYTPSGRNRSFAQLHYAYTAENIVRAMTETQKQRGEMIVVPNANGLLATATPEYDSIADVKQDSGRLRVVDDAEYRALLEDLDNGIGDVISSVRKQNKAHSDNSFEEMDIIGNVLISAASGKHTTTAIVHAFAKEGYTVDNDTARMIQALYYSASQIPTGYFEAKPERVVGFDEALAVVVPNNTDAGLMKQIEEAGMPVRTYEAGNETARLNVINSVENAQFSLRDSTGSELTEAQQEYFADSAVLDENGALQVMYHATDSDFTVFSREHAGENTYATSPEYGATAYLGFWFNSQESAEGLNNFARREAVYLKVENPYRVMSLDSLANSILSESDLTEDAIDEIGEYAAEREMGENFRDWLELNGYDGVILHDEEFGGTSVVALYPEQIKRVNNLNPTNDPDIRFSLREGMTEAERYKELKDASINVPAYDSENGVLTQQSVANLERMINRDARYYVSELFDKLGLSKTYENKAAQITFEFSSRGKKKSVHEQSARGNSYADFAKMLTCFDQIVEGAVPIEIHADKYKGTRREVAQLKSVYVLVSAFADDSAIVPVQLEIKEYVNEENQIYLAVTMGKIKEGVVATSLESDITSSSEALPSYTVSLQELFSKINPSDGDFLKYVPDGFLSEEQRSAKQAALMREERKIDGLRFSLRDTSSVDIATVEKENAQLREANEELRKQFQRTVGVQLDQKAIRKMARDLLKQYDSSYSIDTLTDNLSKVFDVVANGGLTWDEASSAVVDMCRKVLEESSSFDTGLYEYDQPVRDYLKNVRLEISDDMRGGIELVADNGAAYRRGLFGIVGVAKKGSGVSIDQMWSEASEMFPTYFSEDIVNAEDQAERLYYLAQSLKRSNYFTNVYEQNIDAAAYDMMLQIGAKYLDVPQSKTFADKFAEKLETARKASRDAIRQKAAELRAQQKTANRTEKLLDAKITQMARVMLAAENRANRYQEQLATERETAKQRIRDIRTENAQEKQKLAEEYRRKNKEKLAELRENYSRNKLTRQISDSIKSIRKLFENGRGMANVKQGMRDTVRSTLGAAEVLFSPDVKDSDLILNSQIPVSQDEQALIQRYRMLSRARGNYLDLVDRGIDADANSKLAAKAQREMLKLNKQLTALGTLDRMRDAIFSQRVDSALEAVADAYALLDTSADGYISSAYDQDVADYLRDLKAYLKGQIIANMDNDQLKALRDGFKMVLHTIREQNAAFVSDRRETVEQRSTDTMDEVTVANPDRQTKNTSLAGIRRALGWDNLKPFYAFEKMQSPTLMRLFQNVRAGEDVWVVDVNEARDYFQNLARQYGYFDIDGNKRFTFTDKSGKTFELSIPQMMSLYAYSKRAAAMQHLENGGFVFDDNVRVTDQKGKTKKNVAYNIKQAHVIDRSIVQDVVSELQKQNAGYLTFVDQMQSYLSKTMGAKGNEVSMKLYGVEMFGEAFYFPIITPGDNGSKPIVVNDTFKIKNSGFTQALNPNAVGTIVLSDFMDVWAKHINDMAMYHAFTLPLEDMNRVMNYRVRNENGVVTDSVRMRLTNAFTSDAVNYINQFMTDINNGIRGDNRETFVKRMLSGFKKAKVFVNASVVIQQYSAIVRSTDVIDPKYFIGVDKQSIGKKWKEVKRFAPIAAVKEMGHFDTGISGSTEEYIQKRSYQGIGENVKAFFTERAQTEAALSFAPEFADKIAWTQIWSACKRKAADLNPNLSGDALLQKAGEYFTDAIVRTQVYDSTLSKSGLMRSKSAFLNMATAFMAEPTTTLNMLQHSLSDAKRGKPRAALRTVGSVFGSVMLNALLASIVFAARDDDEDKTYLEKYFAAVTSDFLDGINPLTMAPIVKDAWSLLQGYDVARSDMTLMSDTISRIKSLVQTLSNLDPKAEGKELEEQNRELRNQAISTATAVANLFGLPFDNIVRDIRALFNTFGNTAAIKDTNGKMIRDSVLSALQDQIPVWNWLKDAESTSDKLYDAIRDGNAEYFARLTRGYEKDSQTNSAIQRALKENEDRITEAAKARMEGRINDYKALVRQMVSEYGLAHAGETTVQDNIIKAIIATINELEDSTPSESAYKPTKQLKMDDYVTAMSNGREKDANTARETIIKEMVDYDGKTQDKAEESFVSSAVSAARSRYEDGEISEQTALRIIMDAKDCSKSDARYTMTMWELQRKNPDVSNGRIEKWYNDVKSSGISLAVYNDYAVRAAECNGVDSNGDGKIDAYSAKNQKLAVIDSLPISNEQKDFLYRLEGWAESKLYQAPWH